MDKKKEALSRLKAGMTMGWRVDDDGVAGAYPVFFLLALRARTSFMRACQPGPVLRKASITALSRRRVICCLVPEPAGRPRRMSFSPI